MATLVLGTPMLGGGLPANQQQTRYTQPLLVTVSLSVAVPINAIGMYVFLGAPGGSGSARKGTGGAGAGSTGAFGAFYLNLTKLKGFYAGALTAAFAIGAASAGNPTTGTGSANGANGIAGGNTVLTIAGLTITAIGGKAGLNNAALNATRQAGGNMSFVAADTADIPVDFVFGNGLPMIGISSVASTRYGQGTTTSSAAPFTHAPGGGSPAGDNGGSLTGLVIPPFLASLGFSVGTTGVGSTDGSTYGVATAGAGFNGSNPNANTTGTAVAPGGYCAGSNGVFQSSTATNIQSALPGAGVAAYMFELGK